MMYKFQKQSSSFLVSRDLEGKSCEFSASKQLAVIDMESYPIARLAHHLSSLPA